VLLVDDALLKPVFGDLPVENFPFHRIAHYKAVDECPTSLPIAIDPADCLRVMARVETRVEDYHPTCGHLNHHP
jgi:hypothetical protein